MVKYCCLYLSLIATILTFGCKEKKNGLLKAQKMQELLSENVNLYFNYDIRFRAKQLYYVTEFIKS